MVISSNPEPNKLIFQSLLDSTVQILDIESKKNQKKYLELLGNKLENVVADVMSERAKGTPFENSIELISGQKFPDIIANKYYGVEVKTTKQNHWITTGNSVLENTRVDGIDRIFMFFGKMVNPIEFKCRPYEDCLSDVVVTHSPRYRIDMNLQKDQTIFNKLKIPYDTLRNYPNPIKPITDYYRSIRKPGDEIWWLDQEEEKGKSLIIRFWSNISSVEKTKFTSKAMVLFPEVFQSDFNRYALWLYDIESIICPNIRDQFSAGGLDDIEWKTKKYKVPRIIINLTVMLEEVKGILINVDKEELINYWKKSPQDRISTWIDLVDKNTKHLKLQLNIKEYLKDNLKDL